MKTALCAIGVMLAVLGQAREVALAGPVVKIRARTEIRIDSVKRSYGGVQIRGEVVDKYNLEPVPSVWVIVRMNEENRVVQTDDDGTFQTAFDVSDGRYDVSVEFEGDPYYDGGKAEMSGVDVTKQALELSVRARDVAYSEQTIEIVVKAWTRYGGAAIEAELFAGPRADELQRLDTVTTDQEGRGTVHLERERLGKPGRKRLMVRFHGNRVFNPADAQSDFLLTSATRTTFALDDVDIAYEADLTGSGRVVDDSGNPVANAPVALLAGPRYIASALTDAGGRFELTASGDEIGSGKVNVQAVFDSPQPWYRKSRSDPIQVAVAQPQPVPVSHTLAAFGATALAMMAFLGLRTKPWEAWLARLARRRGRDDPSPHPFDQGDRPAIRRGLQPARPGLVSTFRRPHAFDFSGTVCDSITGRPVAGATIAIHHPSAGQRAVATEADGQFAFSELETGHWSASCTAHGYVTEEFGASMPHRGELHGVRVDLLPVRERIFAIYRDVAEPLLPDPELWGIWTPRQIFNYVREERPASALAELTDFVEEAYFSQRIPAESILPEAEQRASQVRVEISPYP